MLSIAYYFLQVSLCSAVMMLYYALVLRNKRFHQYNRFYLLGVAVLPWLMPLVKIDINKSQEAVSIPIQLFSVIADTNSEFEKTVADKGFQFTWETLVATLYIAVSSVLLAMLLMALVKIYKLLKANSCKNLDDVYLVLTQANGTPFSFFKFIFWHTDIDVTTTAGKQMLQHELTHVREKHSLDKLLLQIVLIVGWPNPIFWLLKRELETIHEFIADNKAIDNGDTAALATMLLAAAYPQQRFALTNPFFYSPIKRRIAMLTNNKNPRFSYARRLVVLPLLVTVTLLFAFRKKEATPITISVASALENVVDAIASPANDIIDIANTNAKLTKTYTVVIDAGHGGTDAGALGIDGKSFEKDIALSIAKLVKVQNANANINIVLTRDNDVFMTPVQKADYANKANADLFLSVHCNLNDLAKSSDKSPEGVEIYIANKEKARNYQLNYDFAASLSNSLVNQVKSDKTILTRYKGIWVLQATNCPSALVECGYMDNKVDLQNLTNPSYQQTLATNILKGIEAYLVSKEKGVSAVVVDTVPKKKVVEISLSKAGDEVNKLVDNVTIISSFKDVPKGYLIEYKNKLISYSQLDSLEKISWKKFGILLSESKKYEDKYGAAAKKGIIKVAEIDPVLVVIDGKEMSDGLDNINPNSIKSVNVLKDKKATDKYGEKGKNGVIEVELKKESQSLIRQGFNENTATVGNIAQNKVIKIYDVPANALIIYQNKTITKAQLNKLYKTPDKVLELTLVKSKGLVSKYGKSAQNGVITVTDLNPLFVLDGTIQTNFELSKYKGKIKYGRVLSGKDATDAHGERGKNGVIQVEVSGNDAINSEEPIVLAIRNDGTKPLYIINGKRVVDYDLKIVNSNTIKSINVLKDKNAIDKYGEAGKNGVVEIELKKSEQPFDYKKNGTMRFNGKDTFYTYVKIDAEFPGGKEAWAKYLERNLRLPEEAKIQHVPVGKYTVIVTFTVNVDGTLSNISTLNNPGFGMAEAAVNLITKGPKWLVAVDNSKRVASVIKREIVFTVGVTSVFKSNNPLEQAVATQRVLPTELKKFQKVSADISEVFWIGSVKHLVIKIQYKNGSIESYDLFDAKSKSIALAKYNGSLLLNCKFVLKAINEQQKLLKV